MDEFNGKMVPTISMTCGYCGSEDGGQTDDQKILADSMNRKMYLENSDKYDFGKVGIWVDMINNPENHELQDRINNPIKIK